MADVVIEAVGRPEAWDQIISVIAPRGRIGMMGLFAGQRCSVDFDPLVIGRLTLPGSARARPVGRSDRLLAARPWSATASSRTTSRWPTSLRESASPASAWMARSR